MNPEFDFHPNATMPLRQALRTLYDALRDAESTASNCDQCRPLLNEYCEAARPGLSVALAPVHRHLAVCQSCAQMYLDLVELEKLEANGALPPLSRSVPFNLPTLE